MQRVYEFLKECGHYYLATIDGDRPRVRPFGTALIFEDKLYIQTGKVKDVSKQMMFGYRDARIRHLPVYSVKTARPAGYRFFRMQRLSGFPRCVSR